MTPSQKLRSIADSTGLDGIANAIREVADEIEHDSAPAVPQGWKLVQTPITEEMHAAAVKVLNRANGIDGLPQRMLDAMLETTPAAPSQPVTLTEDEIDANTVWFDPDPHDNVHCDVHATVNKCIAALREKEQAK